MTTAFGRDDVAALATALVASPYRNDTAPFVTGDDPGGRYDRVAPPQRDRNGLGFRAPLIVIGKYAERGYVSHVRHEDASLRTFVASDWRLPSLGTTDRRADDLRDVFDVSAANGANKAFVGSDHPHVDARSFLSQVPLDTIALDDAPQER